ncbi:MAG: tetratricopeptide repeat protein [Planctomycetota bacterium]
MNDWADAEDHVERAHEAYDAGRWDEAENELRRALSLNPFQAEWHFNLGLTLEAAGRHADAGDAFGKAFELQQAEGAADVQAAVLAATNFIRAERAEDALPWLDRADALEAGRADIAVQRIDALTSLERHEEAEEVFYVAQQNESDDAELYAAMAESLLDRELHEKAVWCLREAARLDPELPRVRARLAEAFASTGRLERARQLYMRELRADPGDTETLLDLGELLIQMHRFDEAGEKLRRVLELEPDNADAHWCLADLADRQNNLADGLIEYDVVLRLDADYPGARRRLTGLLLKRARAEDLPRAGDLLRLEKRAMLATPDDFDRDDVADLGSLLLDAGMARDAVTVLRESVSRFEGDHELHHLLGVALLESDRVQEGVEHTRQALVFHPRYVPAMHNLALAYMRQKHWLRARYWANRALKIDPHDEPLRRLRLKLRLRALGGVMAWVVGRWGDVAAWAWGHTLGRPRRRVCV